MCKPDRTLNEEPRFVDIAFKDVTCGKGVLVVRPTNAYGCHLGDEVFVGPFCEIQAGAEVGARTKVQSHSFICNKVTIGEDCFIGHGVTFVNDLFKTGSFSRSDADWKTTVIGNNVCIGSGCCILPVKICSNVVIGAGSVVTKDITEPGVYLGNPARKNLKSQIALGKGDETILDDICLKTFCHQPLECGSQKPPVALQQQSCFSGLLKIFGMTAIL
eukprot:TRINITY_DN6400_c0_g2_i1.p1 TRINITY_DN6400_c0_g2~~TRINITY_DN6400_c0_g2_i1.p1  ORF type:complete len:239 (+),score=30.37 TRINITY_DN6400_c0_g2_i1:69-719(+)